VDGSNAVPSTRTEARPAGSETRGRVRKEGEGRGRGRTGKRRWEEVAGKM